MKFGKKLAVYFWGTIFNKLCIFILLPMYTNHSTTEEYAQYDLAISTILMLVAFIFMEMQTSILRFSKEDQANRDAVFSNANAMVVFLLPIYALLCLLLAHWFSLPHVGLMILYGVTYQVLYNAQLRVRAEKSKTKLFVISGIVSSGIQLILGILFLLVCNKGIIMMMISPIIGNAVAIVLLYWAGHLSISRIFKDFSWLKIRRIFLFSLPLGVNGLATWGMTTINRYIVLYAMDAEQNAYIGVANKFSAIINMFVLVFSLAWQEESFDIIESENYSPKYSKVYNEYLLFVSVMTGIVNIATVCFFNDLFDERYLSTLIIMPLYYIAAYLNAMNNYYVHAYTALKRTGLLLVTTIVGVAVNIIALLQLVKPLGLVSIPVGLILGYFVSCVLRHLLLRHSIHIRINLWTLFISMVVIVVTTLLTYWSLNRLWLVSLLVLSMVIAGVYFSYHWKLVSAVKEILGNKKKR